MTRVRGAAAWAWAAVTTFPGWLPVARWWLRLQAARVRGWWTGTVLDRRVRTFVASASVPRELMAAAPPGLERELTKAVLEAAREQARDLRFRIVTDGSLEVGYLQPTDFARNRTTVRASVRSAGYPTRRLLVLWDLLRSPVDVAFGWLLLYVLTIGWLLVSRVVSGG